MRNVQFFEDRDGNTVISVLPEVTFEIKPTPYMIEKRPKRWAWLARLCWKLLHRLEALEPWHEKIETWRYCQQDKLFMAKQLFGKLENLWDLRENPDRYVVIIGQVEFRELLRSPDTGREFMFNAGPFNYVSNGYRRAFGVDFWVVPHLSGWAMVPRAIIERTVEKKVPRHAG